MTKPSFEHEFRLRELGYRAIAGIDEVGRGCFAGPLVAAAVILPPSFPHQELLNDSKLLKPDLREKLSAVIKLYAICYSVVVVPVVIINQIGIGKAGERAFTNCAEKLSKSPDFLLVDAFAVKKIPRIKQKAIIHGDQISFSIAAASIIAKVYRDSLMADLHSSYPEYHFDENKGYGTASHRDAIKKHGLTQHHRTSFNLNQYLISQTSDI